MVPRCHCRALHHIAPCLPLSNCAAVHHNNRLLTAGTIGHVAHGKSTVVKAISGVMTVRFKNELERNITIKLGYANAKIYKAKGDKVPRPACYRAYGSSKEDTPKCEVSRLCAYAAEDPETSAAEHQQALLAGHSNPQTGEQPATRPMAADKSKCEVKPATRRTSGGAPA